MKGKEKKKYVSPDFKLLFVKVEDGIAVGSGTATPNATPYVEDWEIGEGTEDYWDAS